MTLRKGEQRVARLRVPLIKHLLLLLFFGVGGCAVQLRGLGPPPPPLARKLLPHSLRPKDA